MNSKNICDNNSGDSESGVVESEASSEKNPENKNAIFSGSTYLENLKKVKKNFVLRASRKSAVKDSLPVSHRPQNILAALILTVGIAMIGLDIPIYSWVAELPNEYKWFFSTITDIGKSNWILVITGIFMLAVLAIDWSVLEFRTKMTLYILWTYAGFIFFSVAASGIIALILKWSFGRARPVQYAEHGAVYFDMFHFSYAFTSFPSGHSTTVAALGTALCLIFPGWLWFVLVIGLWLVVSRVMVSAHYPSDVIAGTFLGITVTLWTARFLATRRIGFMVLPNRGVRRFAGNLSCSVCFRRAIKNVKKVLLRSERLEKAINGSAELEKENSESAGKK